MSYYNVLLVLFYFMDNFNVFIILFLLLLLSYFLSYYNLFYFVFIINIIISYGLL